MSVRNFERVFTREVRSAPSRYVAQLRVEAARCQFAQTEKSIDLAPKARVNLHLAPPSNLHKQQNHTGGSGLNARLPPSIDTSRSEPNWQ